MTKTELEEILKSLQANYSKACKDKEQAKNDRDTQYFLGVKHTLEDVIFKLKYLLNKTN